MPVSVVSGLVGLLLVVSGAVAVEPSPSLCTMDTTRGAIPASFALEACVDAAGVVLRNQLDVPVKLALSGDVGTVAKISSDLGGAALATRALHPDPLLVLPGDLVRVPFGAGGASISVGSDQDAYRTYLFATTMLAFIPGGRVVDLLDAFTGLIKDWSDALLNYNKCMVGANWIQQIGCVGGLSWGVTFAFGKAVVLGLGSAIVQTVLGAGFYLAWLGNQVPSIEKIIKSERTISIAAKTVPPPPPPPPPAPVACPGASTFARAFESAFPPNKMDFRIVRGAKCEGGWAAAFGTFNFNDDIGRNPPALTKCAWMVLRHNGSSWRHYDWKDHFTIPCNPTSPQDSVRDNPMPKMCQSPVPASLRSFLGC